MLIDLKFNEENKSLYKSIDKLMKLDIITSELNDSLHAMRIFGNEAAHPGTIDFNEEENNIIDMLFELINEIVESTITKEKRRKALLDKIPEKDRKDIHQFKNE